MIFQLVDFTDFQPILSFIILLILMILMLVVYLKVRIFLVVLVIFLFSLVIGIGALVESNIPFTPYIQIFFLMFQLSIFITISIEAYQE